MLTLINLQTFIEKVTSSLSRYLILIPFIHLLYPFFKSFYPMNEAIMVNNAAIIVLF